MTQSFDEWFDKEYSNYGNSHKKTYDEKHDIYGSQFVDERYDAYKAGQQSCQAEVDGLQKKIDDAINCLEQNKPSLKMEYRHAINALSILKGEETK